MAYQSEIEKLEQRYRENPDQWFAALADSYRKAGNLELALDVVRAGLEKRPNYVSGHIVLGRCLLQQPDDGAAAQAFEKVLSLDAENVIALKALSEVAERAGRLPDAMRWLSRLLEVDPMNDEAEQALARLKHAAASAPPPPSPAAKAAGAAEAAEGAEGAEAAAVAGAGQGPGAAAAAGTARPAAMEPVSSLEATVAERPAVEPEFTIEKSLGATEEPALGPASLDALELGGAFADVPDAPAAPAALPGGGEEVGPGLEPVEFEPPSAAETPAPAPELEPMAFESPEPEAVPSAPSELGVQPFDDQLAWGTGERLSGAITRADLEAAEQAHEATLEPPARELPGLEAAEVPPVGVEERVPSGGGGVGVPGGDLPLIFPEEVKSAPEMAAREAEVPAGSEPEPVVTETMAELYIKQGLMTEARDIYRKLAAARPGDAALASRLDQLEGVVAGRRPPAGAGLVSARGARSAREFLAEVFGAAAPSSSVAPPAPTRRASDEVSLAAVFGEEPAPAPPLPAPAPPEPAAERSGFSFDEFFGAERKSPAAGAQTSGEKGGGDQDDFKRWLKGLKS